MQKQSVRNYRAWQVSLLIAVALVGCGRREAPRFSSTQEFTPLINDATDEEERQLWVSLQKELNAELAKRCGAPLTPISLDSSVDAEQLRRGAEIYAYRCQSCHGVDGNGAGMVAQYLDPLPRDYRKGIFKFTATPYGVRPRRMDLIHTLRRGVLGTSMPSFSDLAPDDLAAVAEYVIFLSQRGEFEQELFQLAQEEEELNPEFVEESVSAVLERWAEAQSQLVMPLTPMPRMTAETIARGAELYQQQACSKCHGVDGRGGLAGGIEIGKDAWGHPAAAADLTSGMFRGGGRPVDIYRRIYSGINGTPMPGFSDVFAKEPNDIWHFVHFVRDMGERRRRDQPPPDAPQTLQPASMP